MSQQSRRITDEMPAVVNSGSRQIHSRDSNLAQSVSKSNSDQGSGKMDVVMDVGNNWPPDSAPGALIEERRPDFWRKTMMFVMSPFVLTGAPVLSSIISDNNQELDTTIKWLKYLMTTPKLLPINGLGVIITSGLNLWMFYLLFDIFVKLFILGEVPKHFLDTFYEFFEVIPIVLAVDLFWIKGYLLKDVIYRLDTVSLDPNESNTRPVVIKLIVIYVLCVSLHVINYFTFQWRLQFGYTSETSGEYLEHLPHRLVNTFLIPVYITFCCAIHVRYQRMNGYVKQLIARSERPDAIHLKEIKLEFKSNGQLIARINSTFNLVMSAFFVVILIGIARDCLHTFWSILAYTSFLKAIDSGSDRYQLDLMREMVRCISADVLVLGMKFSLFGITAYQMIAVNWESRSAPIHLNDLFSQFDHLLQSDLYRNYRILKYYMKSRLEKTDRPSLLKISLLSSLPFIKSKLSTKLQ